MSDVTVELRLVVWPTDGRLLFDAELIGDGGATVLVSAHPFWEPTSQAPDAMDPTLEWLMTPPAGTSVPGPAAARAPAGCVDPMLLPDRDVASRWGQFLTRRLIDALGRDVLADLSARSNSESRVATRIAVRARGAAARIPFETILSPLGDEPPLYRAGVSIVRIPDRLTEDARTPAPLAVRQPGRQVTLLAAAQGHRLDLHPAEFGGAVQQSELFASLETEPFAFNDSLDPTGRLTRRLLEVDPDVLFCYGHGQPSVGWDLGAGLPVSGHELAHLGAGRVASAILAMCGSAAAAEVGISVAEQLAEAGLGITIGMQGGEVPEDDVIRFGRQLAAGLSARAGDGGSLSLEAWELAVTDGRRVMGDAGVLPVVFCHPQLLAGYTQRTRPSRAGRPLARDRRRLSVTATPWYVPGQLAWLHTDPTGSSPLRIPVPADAGTVLTLALTSGSGGHSVDAASALGVDDLAALTAAWGITERRGFQVRLTGRRPPRGCANRSAELSAVIRALKELLGEPPPAPVLDLLDSTVASDWGCHDARMRVIDPRGQTVANIGPWPSLVVTLDLTAAVNSAVLERQRQLVIAGTGPVADVVRSVREQPRSVMDLAAATATALAGTRDIAETFRRALGGDPRCVAIPAVAHLTDPGESDGWVRLADVEPSALAETSGLTASNVLRG